MNLSKPFINRPVLTTLLMFTLVVFGIISYKNLGVAAIPEMQFPTIEVSVSYPGASPQEMAERIANPLERMFLDIEGINLVSSSNSYGSSTIILNFHETINVDVAAQGTSDAIQKATSQLPNDLPNNPTYRKVNPSSTPVLFIVTPSPAISKSTLYKWGDTFLAQQLSTVNGIGNIDVHGTPYAIRVYIDPQKIAARNISMQEVSTAISSSSPYQPAGKFYGKETSITAISEGQLLTATEYNKVIVKYQDNQPVRIEDVGYAIDDVLDNKVSIKWVTKEYPEGENFVLITVLREMGYNTIKLCDDIYSKLDELKKQIPTGMKVLVPFTLSKWIVQAIDDVKFTLLISFILVIIIVYLYLGKFTNTIIPVLALPITICGTFIFMNIFGYTIDIFSLSALTVSMGFLIDDAIIVLENIVRIQQLKGDLDPYQAAMLGAKQIILPVVAISICLVAVFIPVLFLPGAIGQIFNTFSATVIIAVLYSAFISLSLTPMLCSRFVHEYKSDKKTKVEILSDKINDKGLKVYERFLVKALKYKFLMVLLGIISVAISTLLFSIMPKEFLPDYDLGVIQCFAQAREGTSPEEMTRQMNLLQKKLIKQKYIYGMAALTSIPTDNQGFFIINLVDAKERPSIQECIKLYKKIFDQEIDLKISQKPYPLINLSTGGTDEGKAKYQYLIQSYNQDELYSGVQKLIQAMKESKSFSLVTSNLMINSPTYKIQLDRNRSYSYGGLVAQNIEENLRLGYSEPYVAKINTAEEIYYVILELTKPSLRQPTNIDKFYIKNNNDQVAMNQVIKGELVSMPETINHVNTLNAITIQFNTSTGVALNQALNELNALSKKTLSPTVIATVAGDLKAFEDSILAFIFLIVISFLVVYVVLGILYENFVYPLVPLSVLPLAIFGGLLTLLIFGQTISIFALVGLLMLIGIVLKNGILLIDFALEEKSRGVNRSQAMYNAAITRFRPILMTTLAAIVGAIPIALGVGGSAAQGRAPLGLVVVGGLVFSQLVTLFITPAVYVYIDEFNDFMQEKYKLFQNKEK